MRRRMFASIPIWIRLVVLVPVFGCLAAFLWFHVAKSITSGVAQQQTSIFIRRNRQPVRYWITVAIQSFLAIGVTAALIELVYSTVIK